jgi:DNA-binding FadR family transcriptional regulator
MSWEIADRNSLSENVTEQILVKIKDGTYKPGDTLPSQQQLASMMRVGVAAVREAIQRLEVLGVVEVSHGRRTKVKANGQELVLRDPESFLLVAKKGSLDYVWEARHIVEIGIAALAAQRATPGDIDAMGRILKEENSQENPDFETNRQLNNEFHLALAGAAHNPVLTKIATSLLATWTALGHTYLPEMLSRSHEVHRAIYEATKKHDPEAAVRAMEAHTAHSIEESRRSVDALLSRKKQE